MFLEFNDLKFDKYNLSFNMLENNLYVIYGKDQNKIKELLLLIAGINKVSKKKGNITFNKNNVYDNEEYFKSRIFFDMHYNYLNTITPSIIKENLLNRFNINYDEKLFRKKLIELNARREVKINSKSEFTKLGLSLVNYSLATSIQTDNLIIYDIFHNIDDEKKREYIVNDIMNMKLETAIISAHTIDNFLNKNVRFVILGDYENAYIISKEDKFIITEDSNDLKHRIFKLENNMVICLKEDEANIKKGLFKSVKKKDVSLTDFSKYGYDYVEK